MLAVGITFTVIFGITAVSCLGAAGLFTPNTAVLQAILQDSFMAENAAAMGSFALGAVRITGWCFAAVTAVFVWMITAGASRLKASKTLLRLAEAAEGFDCKKGLPLEAVDEKKTRALKWVRRFIRNGWLSVEKAVITVGAAQPLFLGEGKRQEYGMIRFDAEPFDVSESYMRLMLEN